MSMTEIRKIKVYRSDSVIFFWSKELASLKLLNAEVILRVRLRFEGAINPNPTEPAKERPPSWDSSLVKS